MRLFMAVAAAWLVLVAPAAAQNDPQACAIGGGPHEYQERLLPLMHAADVDAAAREAVGSQFAGLWLSGRDQGWAVGLAPGALSVEQAHAAIADELATRVSGKDLETLASTLHVHAQLYADAELVPIRRDILTRMEALDGSWSLGISCWTGDTRRVWVELYADATPDLIARAQEIVAPYGDRAGLHVNEFGPPVPAPAAPLGMRDLVAFPKACVSGAHARIVARSAARAAIRRMTVTVAGTRRTREIGRLGKPVAVRLGGESTRVVIAVRLRDGHYAKRTIVLKRCG